MIIFQKRATSPRPSHPFHGGEGEPFAAGLDRPPARPIYGNCLTISEKFFPRPRARVLPVMFGLRVKCGHGTLPNQPALLALVSAILSPERRRPRAVPSFHGAMKSAHGPATGWFGSANSFHRATGQVRGSANPFHGSEPFRHRVVPSCHRAVPPSHRAVTAFHGAAKPCQHAEKSFFRAEKSFHGAIPAAQPPANLFNFKDLRQKQAVIRRTQQ